MRLLLNLGLLFVLLPDAFVFAQIPRDVDFRETLSEMAAFSADDLSALDQGKIVVRSLVTKDDREIGVIGVVRVQTSPGITLSEFTDGLTQKSNKSLLATGRFGGPPTLEDLRNLSLDKNDVGNLQKCSTGDCKLRLSDDLIERLRTQVDWNSAQSGTQANQLFQQDILEFVVDYLKRGDQALAHFDNDKNESPLADQHRTLQDETPILDWLAPDLAKYLGSFPRVDLKNVQTSLDWSKLTFGLKPFVTVTHASSYSRLSEQGPIFIIAVKQIYASRYFDSSLTLSMLVRTAVNGSVNEYLVFTNISRSDALGGVLSGLKRTMAATEAKDRAKDLLERAKTRLEADPDPVPPAPKQGIGASLINIRNQLDGNGILIAAIILAIAALTIYFIGRSRSGT
jgi:hypothetical protein